MKKKILGIKIKIRHSLRIPEMVRKTKKKKELFSQIHPSTIPLDSLIISLDQWLQASEDELLLLRSLQCSILIDAYGTSLYDDIVD